MTQIYKMTEILNTPHEIVDIPKAKKLVVSEGVIKFDKVSFYYQMGWGIKWKDSFHLK